MDCFQRGLYYDPSHPELNFSLAVAHLALDAPAPALRCLSLLLHAHPKYKPQTHLLLAIAHSKMGDPAAALQAVTHFLTAKPLDTEGLFLRAKLYLQRKDYALAVQDLDVLLAKEGRHLAGLLMKVRCLGAMGRWEEALGVVREGLAAVGEGEGGQTQLRM